MQCAFMTILISEKAQTNKFKREGWDKVKRQPFFRD